MLIKHGANVNDGSKKNETALTWAAYKGNFQVRKSGIDPNCEIYQKKHLSSRNSWIQSKQNQKWKQQISNFVKLSA